MQDNTNKLSRAAQAALREIKRRQLLDAAVPPRHNHDCSLDYLSDGTKMTREQQYELDRQMFAWLSARRKGKHVTEDDFCRAHPLYAAPFMLLLGDGEFEEEWREAQDVAEAEEG